MNKPIESFLPQRMRAVLNQAAPALGFNAFTQDEALGARVQRGAAWAQDRCARLGALAGDEGLQDAALLANA